MQRLRQNPPRPLDGWPYVPVYAVYCCLWPEILLWNALYCMLLGSLLMASWISAEAPAVSPMKYFAYDEQFKRHTLKDIEVSFNTYSSNIHDIEQEQLGKLLRAGQAIVRFMNSAKSKIPEAQYMLIIEGQSSKDYYTRNYELSYERALALIKFWSSNGIEFDSLGNCEVLISGSGQSSKFRVQPDVRGNKDNQRFVIHIIPKPGIIE